MLKLEIEKHLKGICAGSEDATTLEEGFAYAVNVREILALIQKDATYIPSRTKFKVGIFKRHLRWIRGCNHIPRRASIHIPLIQEALTLNQRMQLFHPVQFQTVMNSSSATCAESEDATLP